MLKHNPPYTSLANYTYFVMLPTFIICAMFYIQIMALPKPPEQPKPMRHTYVSVTPSTRKNLDLRQCIHEAIHTAKTLNYDITFNIPLQGKNSPEDFYLVVTPDDTPDAVFQRYVEHQKAIED